MDKHWGHFEHGADIGVRGYGASQAAAFEQLTLSLTAVVDATERCGLARKVARLEPLICIKG